MWVQVDEKTGIVTLVFSPTHRAEAVRVFEFALRMYRKEGADVSELTALMQTLKSQVMTIQ